ncbi:hypothetical protein EIK77_010531 [Talaromyces pinophilus]|jgi:hypothetical protein|nr:hypothetical protein EIK77_010531 [Talaromyces pinophilus]
MARATKTVHEIMLFIPGNRVLTIVRGPAKGYVEALEQRLHETEDVLLKIVSQLEQAQLASMLSIQNSFSTDEDSQDKKKSSRVTLQPSRKRGVEYWKSFPLRDAGSIQRWQQDCYLNRSNVSPSQHSEDKNILSQPVRPEISTGDVNVDFASVDNRQSLQSSGDDTFSITERDQVSAPVVGNNLRNRPLRPRARKQAENNSSQLSSWKAAPPKEFQQQFLW